MTSLNRRSVVTGALATAAFAGPVAARTGTLVAAAADLQHVLPEIAAAFQAATGIVVTATYGSTGNMARQIRQGAPFELFMAADESFIDGLARDGVLPDRGVAYAKGRLSLAANARGPFAATLSLAQIVDAARAGQAFRFAIANPEHAPYGQRAVEVLERQGLAAVLTPRLVYGETVAQAAQLIASGAAPVGLIAASLIAAAGPAITAVPIAADAHTPLIQRMAVTRKGGDAARAFYAYLQTADVRALLARSGFDAV